MLGVGGLCEEGRGETVDGRGEGLFGSTDPLTPDPLSTSLDETRERVCKLRSRPGISPGKYLRVGLGQVGVREGGFQRVRVLRKFGKG